MRSLANGSDLDIMCNVSRLSSKEWRSVTTDDIQSSFILNWLKKINKLNEEIGSLSLATVSCYITEHGWIWNISKNVKATWVLPLASVLNEHLKADFLRWNDRSSFVSQNKRHTVNFTDTNPVDEWGEKKRTRNKKFKQCQSCLLAALPSIYSNKQIYNKMC